MSLPPRVRVGLITSLTGGSAYYGKVIRNGIRLAIIDHNLRSAPFDIDLTECDDRSDSVTALHAAAKLRDDGAVAVLGPMDTHATAALLSDPALAGVPIVSPAATGNQLVSLPNSEWFFRAMSSDRRRAYELANWLTERYPGQSILVLAESSGRQNTIPPLYGESLARDLEFELLARNTPGVPICRWERPTAPITPGEAAAFVRQHKLEDRHAAAVAILGRSSDTVPIAKAMRAAVPGLPVYLVSPGKAAFAQAKLGGNVFAITDTLLEALPHPGLSRFRSRYNAEYPSSDDQESIDMYATFGYDAANILIEAIRRAVAAAPAFFTLPIDRQREMVCERLRECPNQREGVMSHGGFTDAQELNIQPFRMELNNGKWAVYTPPPTQSLAQLKRSRLRLAYDWLAAKCKWVVTTLDEHPILKVLSIVLAGSGTLGALVAVLWGVVKLLFAGSPPPPTTG